MNINSNVINFTSAAAETQHQGPTFPALNETAFNAEFRPIYAPVDRRAKKIDESIDG